ncbi:DUF2207 domain-containing protein [Faecalimonas sp.]
MKKAVSSFIKIIKYIFYGSVAIVLLVNMLRGVDDYFGTDDKQVKVADGFTIENYQIILDVKQDNKVDVNENITVNWNEEYHHGLVKFIPRWLEYTGKDKKTIKRKSNVLDLKSTSDPYKLDVMKKKDRIRLGKEDEYVPLGNKKYEIQYTYDMGKDPFKNFDEFIFHAYGDYWGTEIKNASVKIIMPKKLEKYNIHFFTDKYRVNDVTKFVDYTIEGNVIEAKFNQEKYAKYQKEQYCKINGHRENEECKVSEDSMYNGNLERSLTVDIELPDDYFVGGSWTYGWGSFGISIVVILLTIYTIYTWYKYGKDFPKRAVTVEYYPMDNLNAAEIGYIYGNHSMNKLTIALMIQLAAKGYIKIDELKKRKIQITNLCSTPWNEHQKQIVASKPLSALEKIVYNQLFLKENVIIVSEHKTLYKAFEKVEKKLTSKIKNLVIDRVATKKMYTSIAITILTVILNYISYFVVEDMNPSWSILYWISMGCIVVNLVFTIFMKRKTKYGEEISARIKGFKNFLEKVEKPKLEELVMENPSYFYDILPYTYVLNISKKWINKFEDIQIPKQDMGTLNYYNDRSYYWIYNNVEYPESSKSSWSSGGGGGSSRGGGCSSCGGGGSW